MTALPGRSIVAPVVRAHLELAAFLWLQRDALLAADPVDPVAVAQVSERLEANLDGILIAGAAAWPLVMQQLEQEAGAGELFVAAYVAVVHQSEPWLRTVTQLARMDTAAERGLRGALAWLRPDRSAPVVRKWIEAADPFLCRTAVVAVADHRVDARDMLGRLLSHADVGVRTAAYRLASVTNRTDALPVLRKAVQAETDPLARDQAATACVTLGDLSGLPVLRAMAEMGGGAARLDALRLAVTSADAADTRAWLGTLFEREETAALAVRGAGMLGDRSILPWLVRQMQDPALAEAAGQAFLELFPEAVGRDDLFSLMPEDFAPAFAERFGDVFPTLPLAPRIEAWAAAGKVS